jgi:hypothetical protein
MRRRRWLPWGLAALLLAGCGDRELPTASPTRSAAAPCPDARLHVDARVSVGRGAGPLALADGTLWTARPAAGAVVPVAVDTARAGRPVRVGGAPVSVAAAFGSVYVADRDRDRILRIVPRSGAVARWSDIQAPVKIAATDRRLYAISLDDGALYPLEPATRGAGAEVVIPARAPVDAVYVAGELWVLGGADRGLSPFSPAVNGFVRTGVRLPVRVVGAVAAGPGAVWAALPTAHAVARLDTSTLSVSVLRASRGFRPTAIAIGACAVWVGDAGGRVERIDPAGARPPGPPVRVGRALAALVADRDGVWASDPRDGTVVRVAPRG